MSTRQSPDVGSWRGRVAAARPGIWRNACWALLQLVALAALGYAGWRLLGHTSYRIDIDVYRMGGQAWLDDRPLYTDGALFHTPIGLNLPFTYPPLAAIVFCPFAWLGLPAASVTITLITSALLLRLHDDRADPTRRVEHRADGARAGLAAPLVVDGADRRPAAAIWLEPIKSNFAFGQINVVLMTLVIADCVPRRTPWPRGLLLGLGIALKLTPAVFLLYFLLRRDRPRHVDLDSVLSGCHPGRVCHWPGATPGSTGATRSATPIGSERRA